MTETSAAAKAIALGLAAGVGAALLKIGTALGAEASLSNGKASNGQALAQKPDTPKAPAVLSARRLRALVELGRLLPAQYPDAKFREIAPGYSAKKDSTGKIIQTDGGVVLPEHFTTCGYLPCKIGRMEKLLKEITSCGLEQMRINAKKWGAWVEPGEGRLPKPMDPYAIDQAEGPPLIVHVGMVGEAKEDGSWTTFDAGQGSRLNQEAKKVKRTYDRGTNMISGPEGSTSKPRKLAGWVDLDKVPLAA